MMQYEIELAIAKCQALKSGARSDDWNRWRREALCVVRSAGFASPEAVRRAIVSNNIRRV